MVSAMATGSEVFGGHVEGIDVSAVLSNEDTLLCCAWKLLRLFGQESSSELAKEWLDGARVLEAI